MAGPPGNGQKFLVDDDDNSMGWFKDAVLPASTLGQVLLSFPVPAPLFPATLLLLPLAEAASAAAKGSGLRSSCMVEDDESSTTDRLESLANLQSGPNPHGLGVGK
jgi:hypothetical protein